MRLQLARRVTRWAARLPSLTGFGSGNSFFVLCNSFCTSRHTLIVQTEQQGSRNANSIGCSHIAQFGPQVIDAGYRSEHQLDEVAPPISSLSEPGNMTEAVDSGKKENLTKPAAQPPLPEKVLKRPFKTRSTTGQSSPELDVSMMTELQRFKELNVLEMHDSLPAKTYAIPLRWLHTWKSTLR